MSRKILHTGIIQNHDNFLFRRQIDFVFKREHYLAALLKNLLPPALEVFHLPLIPPFDRFL